MQNNLALFGGTFDPLHNGHLEIIKLAQKILQADKVILIPTYLPPHKEPSSTSAENRLKMLELVVENEPNCEINHFEISKKGTSYTIDTINYLQKLFPDKKIYYIIGSDNFFILHTWKKPLELLGKITFLVVNRDKKWSEKDYLKYLDQYFPQVSKDRFVYLQNKIFPAASKAIRSLIKHGGNVSVFIPDYIYKYICEKGLYL